MTTDPYTLVEVHFRKKRINHRVLFGEPDRYVRKDWQRRFAAYRPGQVFGYERWEANGFGTQLWSVAICCAVAQGHCTTLPGIHPGADVWLHASGTTRVRRVLAALDALQAIQFAPESLPERRWRALNLANLQAKNLAQIVEDWLC
ncbi:MAG: DUF2840 domain-containing protein [Litorimonas sp.]